YKSSDGQAVVTRNITASGDHVVNAKDQCPSLVQVTFSIDSGGKPVNSTLDISDVSISCDYFDWSTLAVQLPPQYDDPRSSAYPLPYGTRQNGSMSVVVPVGVSPLAIPFSSGSNSLDAVLPATDETVLYKYNPLTGSFDSYYRSGGQWFPPEGMLSPGRAAFIDSPVPQEFMFTGQYVPVTFVSHPAPGSAFYCNPMPWPLLLECLS